jgi:DNA-directed RNA polymerase subunit K/omega
MVKKKIIKEDSDDEISEDMEEMDEIDEELDFNDEDEDDLENYNDEVESVNDCQLEKMVDDDNDFFDNYENSEIEENNEQKLLKGSDRISSNRLTKYEMVRILGERIKQLTMGAKALIKNYESLSYEKIAEEELKLNMIPFKIKRSLPNGKYEIWTLDELYKNHLLSQLE